MPSSIKAPAVVLTPAKKAGLVLQRNRRVRRLHSLSDELVVKSREAALASVQIFNNPQITFKSEIFIVLMVVAWTYLLHAHYRKTGVEYRFFEMNGARRRFKKKGDRFLYWELEACLKAKESPIDQHTINNLLFLIGIRHEIEHQMTLRIDDALSAKFQACCLNYNEYIKKLIGPHLGIDRHLSVSLQFSSITREQVDQLDENPDLPGHIKKYVEGFEEALSPEEFNSPRFAFRVFFVAKTASTKGSADEVIEFIKEDSELAKTVNRSATIIKEMERKKHKPGKIVKAMQQEGFKRFKMHHHSEFWKSVDARNPGKGFGTLVEGTWYWYDRWFDEVRKYCKDNADKLQ